MTVSATTAPAGAFAGPVLPTPVSAVLLDEAPAGVPTVRWVRQEGSDASGSPDDGSAGPVSTSVDAPAGWRPSAGTIAGLAGDPPRWLVGAGAGTTKDWRAVGAAAVRAVRPSGEDAVSDGSDGSDAGTVVAIVPDRPVDAPTDDESWAALVTGVVLGSHRFAVRSRVASPPPTVHLPVPAAHRPAVERAVELAGATAVARDLADTPSGTKSPDWFARTATDLVADAPGLAVTVRDEQWLAAQHFGGVLAVGGGSSRPPRLLELAWAPAQATGHVVLIGKGITFDTGGISIKPNAGMADMRTDCAGGAAVVAALRAIARLGLPVRVTGLVPLAENHVSGSSYRPGDVVRHRGGRTSEVTNTDAEGRMVLADALAHADATLHPDVVVDVATLTGAMKIALGVRTGGVFATSAALRDAVVACGASTGEAWWPMPLVDDLDADVDSELADVRQAPAGPGGIVAALFLRRFTGGRPWAHLDIAGPARCDAPHEEVAKGATGFAARTLVEFCAGTA